MTTRPTTKLALALAVCLLGMSANAALATCISWINHDYRHTTEQSFVGNELSELIERPTMSLGSLRFPNSCPFVDVRQVFQRNRRTGVFGFLNEFLGNAVVGIGSKSRLTTTDFPQLSFTFFRSFGLQFASQFQVSQPHLFKLVAGIYIPIARYSNVLHTQVHTDNCLWVDGRIFGHITSSVEEKLPITIHQIHLTLDAVGSSLVVVIDDNAKGLSTFQRRQGYLGQTLEGQDTRVIGYTPSLLELRLDFLVEFICLASFGNGSDGQLCGEFVIFTDAMIDQFLDGELGSTTLGVAGCGNIVAGIIERLHCIQQHLLAASICFQFDFDCGLHLIL